MTRSSKTHYGRAVAAFALRTVSLILRLAVSPGVALFVLRFFVPGAAGTGTASARRGARRRSVFLFTASCWRGTAPTQLCFRRPADPS